MSKETKAEIVMFHISYIILTKIPSDDSEMDFFGGKTKSPITGKCPNSFSLLETMVFQTNAW